MGIMRLAKGYGPEMVEAACERAIAIKARSYRSVKSILENRLEGKVSPGKEETPIEHANVRGPAYYREGVRASR